MRDAIRALLKALVPVRLRPKLWAACQAVRFFGFRYQCPLCNSHLRTFLPAGCTQPVLRAKNVIGAGYRRAMCPVCGAGDRQRLLYLYLLHKTDMFEKPLKLLHVAPEACVERTLRRRAQADYLTADLNSEDVMVKMDITDIRFPDNSFDAIICNHVLEHVVDDRKAMSELYRTLRPGGWAILQVPLSLSLATTYEDFSIDTASGREEAFGQSNHVRIYAEDYKERLERACFSVTVFRWTAEPELFGGAKDRYGLNREERVYRADKRL
jgi:SAM-dependent methyltransferase